MAHNTSSITDQVPSQNQTEESELGQFIPLHYHYQMLLDEQRVQGFKQAIEYMVPQGGKVLELGGGTGILSFFASKKAAKVWCVERNPEMAKAAKEILAKNGAKNVEVITADATKYVPPEPVEVVICEMLHSAILREKQIQVISAFQKNYSEKFGSLPHFIPSTTLLGVQPSNQVFDFHGYHAPIPMFFQPTLDNSSTVGLADPFIYSIFHYNKPLPQHFVCSNEFVVTQDGEINSLRFITKNILAYLIEEEKSVDWHNFYLVMPLSKPLPVTKGQRVKVTFSYPSGGSMESLAQTIDVKLL